MIETPDMATPIPAPETAVPPLVVKRYANRKIYVPEQKCYANFASLYQTLLTGRDIVVVCAATHRDVTSQVLGMIYQDMCINTGHVGCRELAANIRAYGPAPIAT